MEHLQTPINSLIFNIVINNFPLFEIKQITFTENIFAINCNINNKENNKEAD